MYEVDAKNENFELIDIEGYFCLFSDKKLDRKTVPDNLYTYEVMKNKKNKIIQISSNHDDKRTFGGSLISRIPIFLKNKGNCRIVNECDFLGVTTDLSGYLNVETSS